MSKCQIKRSKILTFFTVKKVKKVKMVHEAIFKIMSKNFFTNTSNKCQNIHFFKIKSKFTKMSI